MPHRRHRDGNLLGSERPDERDVTAIGDDAQIREVVHRVPQFGANAGLEPTIGDGSLAQGAARAGIRPEDPIPDVLAGFAAELRRIAHHGESLIAEPMPPGLSALRIKQPSDPYAQRQESNPSCRRGRDG
jgi:hypothetical protein